MTEKTHKWASDYSYGDGAKVMLSLPFADRDYILQPNEAAQLLSDLLALMPDTRLSRDQEACPACGTTPEWHLWTFAEWRWTAFPGYMPLEDEVMLETAWDAGAASAALAQPEPAYTPADVEALVEAARKLESACEWAVSMRELEPSVRAVLSALKPWEKKEAGK